MIGPRPLVLVVLSLLWAAIAQATSIAILRPSSSAPPVAEALYRLQGELLALGLEVEITDRPKSRKLDAPVLDGAAGQGLEQRFDAIIDVVGDTTPWAVEIWIVERASRRTRVARVALDGDTPNAAETLAIRAIEVLRANFVEIDLAARARQGESAASISPETAPEPPPRPAEGFGLQAGAAVLANLDGIGPAVLPLVRFDWAASSGLVAQATLAALGTRPTVESALGSATVARDYGLLGLCYCPRSGSLLAPLVSVAAGGMRTLLDGRAEAPAKGHVVSQWSFLGEASIGARLRFSERYYSTLALHVQVAAPDVAVHIVDELVATSGRPNLLFSLTIGAWQ